MSNLQYFVVEKGDILKVRAQQSCDDYLKFASASQARIFKKGLEALNPNNKYCIVKEIPRRYEEITEFTGEERSAYDYT